MPLKIKLILTVSSLLELLIFQSFKSFESKRKLFSVKLVWNEPKITSNLYDFTTNSIIAIILVHVTITKGNPVLILAPDWSYVPILSSDWWKHFEFGKYGAFIGGFPV